MWKCFRGSALNTGLSPYVFRRPNPSPSELPLKKTYVGGIIWGTCVIDAKGDVYVGSSNGQFFRISQEGDIVWRYSLKTKTDSLVDSAAALHPNGFVVIPGGDGHLHAVSQDTGKMIWVLKAPHSVSDAIDMEGAIVNSFEGNVQICENTGLIYAGCDNGYFYCISPEGKEVWSYKANMMIWSCAALIGGQVIFGCLDRYVYVLSADQGELIAKIHTGAEIKSSPLVSSSSVSTRVFIGNANGIMQCRDVQRDLELVWERDIGTEIYASPCSKDGVIVVCTFDGQVWGLQEDTGNTRWHHQLYHPIVSSPIVTQDNVVMFGTSRGLLYFIDLLSGTLLACTQLSKHSYKPNINASLAMDATGVVHVGSYDGYIYHLSSAALTIKNLCDPLPSFMRQRPVTHFELEYDGYFIKCYRLRAFKNGVYIPNAALDFRASTVTSDTNVVVYGSDGKYLNILPQLGTDISCSVQCGIYEHTTSWFYDRLQYFSSFPKVRHHIAHKIDYGDTNWDIRVNQWDIHSLFTLQPKILDTYIPAALDSVSMRAIAYPLNATQVFMVLIPTVHDHDQGKFIILPEPSKVFILKGEYVGSSMYLEGKFTMSSMGGTIPFDSFRVWVRIKEDGKMCGEFVASTSCMKIKGNAESYKFSTEILNQLCDPFMKLRTIGCLRGTPSTVVNKLVVRRGVEQGTYVVEALKNEFVVVVGKNKNGFDHVSFMGARKIKMNKYVERIYVFVDGQFCGSYE